MQWKRQGPWLDGEPHQLLCCQFPDLQFIHDLAPFTLPIAKQVSSLVDLYLLIVFLFVNFTYPYCYLNFILVTFSHVDCYLSFYLVFLSSVSCFSITFKKKKTVTFFTWLCSINPCLPAPVSLLPALAHPLPRQILTPYGMKSNLPGREGLPRRVSYLPSSYLGPHSVS